MITVPTLSAASALNDLKAAGKFADALTMRLIKAALVPDQTTTLAALLAIEADFGGYAAAALGAWGGDSVDAGGDAIIVASSIEFVATDDVTPNLVYGYFYTAVVSTVVTLRGVEVFEAGPYAMDKAGRTLVVVPVWSYPGLPTAGVFRP